MYAVFLDKEKYLISYSSTYRKPGSILVDSVPDEKDPEKSKCYKYTKKKFVFDETKWNAVEAERKKKASIEGTRQNIDDFKSMLESTDYKVIKCMEYALNNLELPYDVEALHAERQALRDNINELETTLSSTL